MGKKKSTTNATTQQTAVSTPNVPTWLQDTTQALNSKIQGLISADPQSFLAKTNSMQTNAQDRATALAGANDGLYAEAAQGYRDAPNVESASLLDGLSGYYNPFKDQVLNPVLNDYDMNSGRTRAMQAASGARNQAFSGSRFGVREAQTEGELARGRAATEGGLLGDMFNTATSLSNQDAGRRQSASESNARLALDRAGGLGNLASAQGANSRADIGLLAGLGNDQYGRDTASAQAPLDLLKTQTGLFAGLNPGSYFGQTTNTNGTSTGTTTESGGLLDTIGKVAQIAGTAAMFSDERLKTGIERVGSDNKGRDVYDYEYLWEPGVKRRGYMAQDLLKTDPHAVKRGPKGFLMVDYEAVD
jgi:hypothetical protein